MQPQCPSPEIHAAIDDYAFGVLDGPAMERIEEHFMGCASCRELLGARQWIAEALRPDAGGLIDELRPLEKRSLSRVVAQSLATLRLEFQGFLERGLLPRTPLLQSRRAGEAPAGLGRRCEDLVRAGDYAGALRALGCAEELQIDRLQGADCWRAGALAHEIGRVEEALGAFERAVASAPGHPWYRWSAVLAALELNRFRDALAHLRALRDSSNPAAARAGEMAAELARALLGASGPSKGDGVESDRGQGSAQE